ncbi:hypothetical protein [Romboutsia sp.]|uniref:hypothetical protein n=1 Tax=Romboutsia sp. TaxID=1965302 RepID=UPI003F2AD56A
MKLIQLTEYIENEKDKEVLERMLKDDDVTINKYVVNVVCDLLQCIPLDESYKLTAKNNFNRYDDSNMGQLGAYVSLFPYAQISLNEDNDGGAKATEFLEMLISYLIGYIDNSDFKKELYEMKDIIEISQDFYKGLENYFGLKKDIILKGINERL